MTVAFTTLLNKVRPKDHIEILKSVLPSRYSPLQKNGNGNQGMYLTELSQDFAEVLAGLIGTEARMMMAGSEVVDADDNQKTVVGDDLDVWERKIEERLASDSSVRDTDREAIIRARRGQGLFKSRVTRIVSVGRFPLVGGRLVG